MTELAMQSLTEVAKVLHAGTLSPIELTRTMLERIEREDSRFHSYVTVLSDVALAQAKVAEEEIRAGQIRGPLHGIPIAVKDLCFTKGIATSCGSQMFTDWIPDVDATVVTKLADAGAILLGKLHMTEFALRWHHPYRPIPLNPWGKDLWPGVSSSGSGVATAAGLCFGSLGSDTGGSIRFPAASCGIVGLKPTYGRVSRYGVFPLGESLDHIGPLTRRTADAAAMLGAIAGYDPLDATSSVCPVPDYMATLEEGVNELRIGVDDTYITEGVHPEVSASVQQAIRVLVEMGAQVVEVTVPGISAVLDAWYPMTAAEAAAAHEEFFPDRANEYGPFRQLLEDGTQLRAQDYAKAHFVREEFASRLAPIFNQIDLLICPTISTPTPRMDAEGNAVMEAMGDNDSYVRTRFTYPFNFSRNPTLSLPCGVSNDGRPISLQFVGRHFDEATLFRAGHAFEQATEWHKKRGMLIGNGG
ncbi:MAG: amidase [Chloroflexota bacterium]